MSFLKAGDGDPTCIWATELKPWGVLSQREEEIPRATVRANVHTRAPESLLAAGAALRL